MNVLEDARVVTLLVTIISALLGFITIGIFKLVGTMSRFVKDNNTEHKRIDKGLTQLNDKMDFVVDKELGNFKSSMKSIKSNVKTLDDRVDDHEKRIYSIEKRM